MDEIFIAIEVANEKPVRAGTLSRESKCLRDGVKLEASPELIHLRKKLKPLLASR
jgi:hypothetical protein